MLFKNNSGKILPAISFNLFEHDILYHLTNNKNQLNLIVQLAENFWNNKKSTNSNNRYLKYSNKALINGFL